jgi:hypothetical protein
MGVSYGMRNLSTAGPGNPLRTAEYIFLDDVREAFPGFILATDVDSVLDALFHGHVRGLSLDHDLGENVPTGYDLVKAMAERNLWPSEFVHIHSANAVGIENMRSTLERYAPEGVEIKVVSFLS